MAQKLSRALPVGHCATAAMQREFSVVNSPKNAQIDLSRQFVVKVKYLYFWPQLVPKLSNSYPQLIQ
jgi:hypothetical protein